MRILTEHKYDLAIQEAMNLGEKTCRIKMVAEFDRKKTDMEFGAALIKLREGKKLTRKGWNGKGQYIELVSNASYISASGETVNAEHKNMGNRVFAFAGTSGVQLGWLASQADMLAEDWMIYDPTENEKPKTLEENTIRMATGAHAPVDPNVTARG